MPVTRFLAPRVLDLNHLLQQPKQNSGKTRVRPALIEIISHAGIVNHIDGLFIKAHPNHVVAKKSVATNMLTLDQLVGLLNCLLTIRLLVNGF